MPLPIRQIAEACGLSDDDILPYGREKAKVSLEALERLKERPSGKLILVTAISPTPAGEGKTVTSLGLGDGLRANGEKTIVCIREPSLGPTLGMKGGGAGGGMSQAHPATDLNLHFTGDFHAVAAAHNLLAALAEAHIYHGNPLDFDPHGMTWNRVLDLTDRSLRQVLTGLGGKANGAPRETGFMITAASEVMALLQLTAGMDDLRMRLGEIVVGVSRGGEPIKAAHLQATGAMTALLRDAVQPNLIQTLEGTPVFAHTGPFGNIATGCNSVISDRAALHMADYVVTEAGFGSDLGFEKFCDIVSPVLGKGPDMAVVVATIRGLKAHSGKYKLIPGKPLPSSLMEEDLEALRMGAVNLKAHLGIVHRFSVPAVVAINRFPGDTEAEIEEVKELACSFGAKDVGVSEAFARGGGVGCSDLAARVKRVCDSNGASFRPLYERSSSLFEKIEIVAKQIYGAGAVRYEPGTKTRLRQFEKWGYGGLPICFAKTQYSLSHDPALLGAPEGFTLPIASVELAAGAGFVRVLCGDIMTMPGLPADPAAFRIDVDESGEIVGVH
jgi:formate--tetrahydrofolate ligase